MKKRYLFPILIAICACGTNNTSSSNSNTSSNSFGSSSNSSTSSSSFESSSNTSSSKPMDKYEIAKICGVTSKRIEQVKNKALRRMRHPSRSDYFKDYADGI